MGRCECKAETCTTIALAVKVSNKGDLTRTTESAILAFRGFTAKILTTGGVDTASHNLYQFHNVCNRETLL